MARVEWDHPLRYRRTHTAAETICVVSPEQKNIGFHGYHVYSHDYDIEYVGRRSSPRYIRASCRSGCSHLRAHERSEALFFALWIPTLTFEVLLCALAVFRGFRNVRLKSSLYYSGKELLDVLLRDSVIYFVVLFTTYVVNMVLFLVEPGALVEIPIVFAAAMSCIMSNRLLLNIRQTVRNRDDVMLPSSQPIIVPFRAARGEFMEMEELGSRSSL